MYSAGSRYGNAMPTSDDTPAYAGPARSDEPTARCARCGAVAAVNTTSMGPNPGGTTRVDEKHAVFIAVCSACGKGTVAVEYGTWFVYQNSGFSWHRTATRMYWPIGAQAMPISEGVKIPDDVLKFWHEAGLCFSVQAYHSAAVMLRNVMAAIANDVGGSDVVAERHLDGKLKKLAAAKPQTGFYLQHMEALKAIGNAGAHPEDWPEVSKSNAETAVMVARYLIEVLYEQPQRIEANLLRRNQKN